MILFVPGVSGERRDAAEGGRGWTWVGGFNERGYVCEGIETKLGGRWFRASERRDETM